MSDISEEDLLAVKKLYEEGGNPSQVRFIANWNVNCSACGSLPTVADTGLCGPCCFGEADALDWHE